MIDERTAEQATAFVFGVLPAAEATAFDRSLADNVELAALVAAYNDATLALAESAPKVVPPAAVRAALIRDLLSLAGASSKILAPAPAAIGANPFFFIGRDEGQWQTLPIPGVRVKDLSVDVRRGTSVKLYELAPGTRFPNHHHFGPEECYVVSGDFHVEGRVLHAGDFHHAESESDHGESSTVNGCTLLIMVSKDSYN